MPGFPVGQSGRSPGHYTAGAGNLAIKGSWTLPLPPGKGDCPPGPGAAQCYFTPTNWPFSTRKWSYTPEGTGATR